jgi:hypothetical protein
MNFKTNIANNFLYLPRYAKQIIAVLFDLILCFLDNPNEFAQLKSTPGPIAPSHSDTVCKYNGPANAGDCSWNKLPFSDSSINYVQPGGDSRCMTASAPCTFIVQKGSRNNILFYFQAGGVCADQSIFFNNYYYYYFIFNYKSIIARHNSIKPDIYQFLTINELFLFFVNERLVKFLEELRE